MPPPREPLIIIDNNLLDDRGHHLALARTLAYAALANGQSVYLYTHRDFRPIGLDPRVHVHPTFKMSTYEVFALKRNDIDLSGDILEALAIVARAHPDGGQVLFHTADAHVYRALDAWLAPRSGRGEPRDCRLVYHVCTPYEPRLLPGTAAKGPSPGECIYRLVNDVLCERRLFFWAETERLAEYYCQAFATSVGALILPCPQWTEEHLSARSVADRRLTLVFLGAAREEKGFMQLPDLAAAIAADPRIAGRVALRIQCSEPLAGYSKVTRAAIARLTATPGVELMHGSLSVEQYANEILGADVVLMLYDPSNYFARGSGIAIEALCSGKYLLCRRGTFVDSMEHHGMARFGDGIADFCAHLAKLAEDVPQARRAAERVGARMRAQLNSQSYLNRLARRERFGHLFHSPMATAGNPRYGVFVAPAPEATPRRDTTKVS